jgi:galactose oxidase
MKMIGHFQYRKHWTRVCLIAALITCLFAAAWTVVPVQGLATSGVDVPILEARGQGQQEPVGVPAVPGASQPIVPPLIVDFPEAGISRAPELVGRWTPPKRWPVVAVNLAVLPNGKVLSWGTGDPGGQSTLADVWDPVRNLHSFVRSTETDLFCAGQSFLADGRLLVAGGHLINSDGSDHTTYFDFRSNSFVRGPDLNAGRWYPSVVTLGDGRALVLGGHVLANKSTGLPTYNRLPQVWQGDQWVNLPAANEAVNNGYYPWIHPTPSGDAIVTGPEPELARLNLSGEGSWTRLEVPRDGISRLYGNSVPFAPGQALIVGGGDSSSVNVLDFRQSGEVSVAPNAPMNVSRLYQNSVLLPTGEVLVVGGQAKYFNGDRNAVLRPESWSPISRQFTPRAAQQIMRLYHSTAVLLPDGRVLSAGGGAGGNFSARFNAELFTPWYLFKPDGSGQLAQRPSILEVPSVLEYGQAFRLVSREAKRISRVTWIRLSTTTHAFDSGQRFFEIPLQRSNSAPDVLRLVAPTSPTLMPPGHYLLTIIEGSGVPSVSSIVQLVFPSVRTEVPGLKLKSSR